MDLSLAVSSEQLSFFILFFSLFFRFWTVRQIKLAIPSAFERMLTHTVSYRIVS